MYILIYRKCIFMRRIFLKKWCIILSRLPNAGKVASDLIERRKFVFRSSDIKEMYGVSSFYAYRIIKRMLRDGLAKKIWRGAFILSDSFLIGVPAEGLIDAFFSGKDYYIGLRYSLLFWRLHDAPTRIIHVLTSKRELSGRVISLREERFRLIYLSPEKFFGYIRVPLGSLTINLSDKEKTIIDCLLFLNRYISFNDICKALILGKEILKVSKLIDYALRLNNKSLIQRLGFLLELLNYDGYLEKMYSHIGRTFIPLNPAKGRGGVKSNKWKIIVNDKCRM